VSVNDLSTLLWRERELLELLVFKLEEEQLLLTAGKSKWLPYATREVEAVLSRIRIAGIERTVEASSVAIEWNIPEDATLRQLVESAPTDVWRDILQAHLAALTGLTAQIADVRDTNLTYLRAANRATQETLANVGSSGTAGGYNDRGGHATSGAGSFAHLFDRQV
jgi:FlgN protein